MYYKIFHINHPHSTLKPKMEKNIFIVSKLNSSTAAQLHRPLFIGHWTQHSVPTIVNRLLP